MSAAAGGFDPDADAGNPPGPGGAPVSVADNPGGVPIDRLVIELPAAIAAVGADARWEAVAVAANGATVWRLDRLQADRLYLKVAPEAGGAADRLRREGDRLAWLSTMPRSGVAVPAVVASATDPESGDHYLALGEVPGVPASRPEIQGDIDELIAALAAGLRRLHELPVDGPAAPEALAVDELLARAGQRVAAGLVDPRGFEPFHARYTPAQLYEHLHALPRPGPVDPVVVHGNPRLDNTLIADGRVTGYVDLGRSGVADRYLDLAVVARELATRVSPHALGPFFAEYGIDAPDVGKIDFYLLLDELL